MKLLCKLGLHKWAYSLNKKQIGSERICLKCERKQILTYELPESVWDAGPFWKTVNSI